MATIKIRSNDNSEWISLTGFDLGNNPALDLGETASSGSSSAASREDHVHEHGNLTALSALEFHHWNSITNKPATFPPASHNHDDLYYLESELQTSGCAAVAWDNLTDKPSSYTPAAHNTTHQAGGADALALDDLGAPSDNTNLNASGSAHGLLPKLSLIASQFLDGEGKWSTPPGVAIPLSDATPASIGTASAGSSGSAARSDHVHAHGDQPGGSLHSTASAGGAGFMPALSGISTEFLNGVGNWETPSSGSISAHHTTHEAGGSDEIKWDRPAPVGTIVMWPTLSPPTNWLLCDGSAYLQSIYPSLYSVIGTTFGSASEGYFKVPDLRYFVPIGADPDNVKGYGALAIGATVGAVTKTIAVANLPSHNHSVNLATSTESGNHTHSVTAAGSVGSEAAHTHGDGSYVAASAGAHTHNLRRANTPGSTWSIQLMQATYADDTYVGAFSSGAHTHDITGTSGAGSSHTHSFTGSAVTSGTQSAVHNHSISGNTGNAGSGTAFNVMQPSLALNFIIRAK